MIKNWSEFLDFQLDENKENLDPVTLRYSNEKRKPVNKNRKPLRDVTSTYMKKVKFFLSSFAFFYFFENHRGLTSFSFPSLS